MKAVKSENAVMRRYYVQTSLLLVAYLAFAVSFFILTNRIWLSLFVTLLLGLLVRYLRWKILLSNFYKILFGELDPERLQNVFATSPRFVVPIAFRLPIALLRGDYQTVVDFSSRTLRAQKNPYTRIVWLTYLARVYFEAEDREKLEKVCDFFDTAFQEMKNPARVQGVVYTFRFYRFYLEGKYEECLALPEGNKSAANKKMPYKRFELLRITYDVARVYYCMGEYEQAKTLWGRVCETAPKLYLAQLAAAHLATMEAGEEVSFQTQEYLPAETNSSFDEVQAVNRKHQKRRRLLLVLMLLFLLPVVIIGGKDASNMQKFNAAASQKYENYSVLTTIPLNFYSGERAQAYLVSADGGLHLLGLREDDPSRIWIYYENIEIGKIYWNVSGIHGKGNFSFEIQGSTESYFVNAAVFVLDGKQLYFLWTPD